MVLINVIILYMYELQDDISKYICICTDQVREMNTFYVILFLEHLRILLFQLFIIYSRLLENVLTLFCYKALELITLI